MKQFDDLLKTMDMGFFASGSHKITFEKMMELHKEDKVFVLDVRTKQENDCITLPFACNIPMNEVPDRLNEIPKDKTIAVFCSSATRATIIYPYLLMQGYDAKILLDSLKDIAANFKPGYVHKNYSQIVK